jgi:hypothetical protein
MRMMQIGIVRMRVTQRRVVALQDGDLLPLKAVIADEVKKLKAARPLTEPRSVFVTRGS